MSFFYFRCFRADCFLVFFFSSFYFLDLNVIVLLKLNAEFNFFSIYYLECIGVQTNFWNSIISVSNCSYSFDQKNAVSCNSVIEEPSFHLVNVVVRIDLSYSERLIYVNKQRFHLSSDSEANPVLAEI